MGSILYPSPEHQHYIISSLDIAEHEHYVISSLSHPDPTPVSHRYPLSDSLRRQLIRATFATAPLICHLSCRDQSIFQLAAQDPISYLNPRDPATQRLKDSLSVAALGWLPDWRLFEVDYHQYTGLSLSFAHQPTQVIRTFTTHQRSLWRPLTIYVHVTGQPVKITCDARRRNRHVCISFVEHWPGYTRSIIYPSEWYLPVKITDSLH